MSIVGLGMNLLLAALLAAALVMGWRLNRRLKALRDSHDGFAVAVNELNNAAARAERGLADLRAATDEAVDTLADRIEKGRALAVTLERLVAAAPVKAQPAAKAPLVADAPEPEEGRSLTSRLGSLLAAAREARTAPEPAVQRQAPPPARRRIDDDLFEDGQDPAPRSFNAIPGGRR